MANLGQDFAYFFVRFCPLLRLLIQKAVKHKHKRKEENMEKLVTLDAIMPSNRGFF